MPQSRPTEELETAQAAVDYALYVRKHHRRRTDKRSKQRQQDIDIALERLKAAMKPLHSLIGAFPYGPQTIEAEQNREEIRNMSAELQRQRRKLWKMSLKSQEKS